MARWCRDTEVLSLCPNVALFSMTMPALEHLEWLLKLFLGYHPPAFLASVLLLSLPSKQIASSRMLADKNCIQLYLADFFVDPFYRKLHLSPGSGSINGANTELKTNSQMWSRNRDRSFAIGCKRETRLWLHYRHLFNVKGWVVNGTSIKMNNTGAGA